MEFYYWTFELYDDYLNLKNGEEVAVLATDGKDIFFRKRKDKGEFLDTYLEGMEAQAKEWNNKREFIDFYSKLFTNSLHRAKNGSIEKWSFKNGEYLRMD